MEGDFVSYEKCLKRQIQSQIHLHVHSHVEAGAFSNRCAQDGVLRKGGESKVSSLWQRHLIKQR